VGTNLFVEGMPAPIVLSVSLRREDHSFREVAEVSNALADIDTFLRSSWAKLWPEYDLQRHRDVLVLQFRVESPPFFQIFADPAWLAVFLLVLTGYKQGKESLAEMSSDAIKIASTIKGLTVRELELLNIAVHLSLARMMEQGEKQGMKTARVFSRARKRLLGETEERPVIVVKDIVNKYNVW